MTNYYRNEVLILLLVEEEVTVLKLLTENHKFLTGNHEKLS